MLSDRILIKPFGELKRRIYGYILPGVPSHEGYVKVGETTRETWLRVSEQVSTLGLTPQLLFERLAIRANGQWFRDKDLHRFFELNGVKKAKLGSATEWFYFDGQLHKAEELTDKYIIMDYEEIQIDENRFDYVLREEQQRAVENTWMYYISGKEPREFLWNAKPRFGKTLTTYDLIRRIGAQNVLIVTNRPAIANSWFDDFQKFIAWQEPGMKFISETDALKEKTLSRKDFLEFLHTTKHESPSQITFLSLQDLKGARVFGGEYDKLEWVADLDWDLLVIDEAHEGIDTERTDVAFEKIKRKFTLHLSGTPFRALASHKFREDQIFNWSYLDEQQAKANWDYINGGTNPYEDLPKLNLFTYQMSRMIEEEVSQGIALESGVNVDYAFDLNEFFSADDQGNFKYEESVRMFLDNLCSGHYPFSEMQHRDELQHTFWLLPRVNSAKAMEKLLKQHWFFKDYTVILAAGDGVSIDYDIEQEATDFKKNEKSYNKVKAAIAAAGDKGKTITLSVGQLTTGVTIPEWSAVLMLSAIKSPSLYFQAAFRTQNPYTFERNGKLYRKENAYIFDFAPDRTLELYDQFASNLSNRDVTREDNIRELLNFFPVIGEDEDGTMKELDASEVLIVPVRIKSKEVVRRGFMSNLLFTNISGIFSGYAPFKEILDKIRPEKNKRLLPLREVTVTQPMLDEDGNVSVPKEFVISTTGGLFGPAVYRNIENLDILSHSAEDITKEITRNLEDGFRMLRAEFQLTNKQLDKVKRDVRSDVDEVATQAFETCYQDLATLTEQIQKDMEEARIKGDETTVTQLEEKLQEETQKATSTLIENINTEVRTILGKAVEEQMVRVEEEKKKTTEDDVRDHLRGFARTIPAFLMAYGNESTTIDNFEENIDEATFEELTGITKDEFRRLRDGFEFTNESGSVKRIPGLFNKPVFNAAVKEFFATKKRLSNYFDETITEDIFDYIPPQKTNQIFTPKRVVKMMVDMVEKAYPEMFSNRHIRFLDPYAKSGLYLAEITKRLFKGLKDEIPELEERIKWILENQVYAIAPSNIIYNIIKNFIYPYDIDVSTKKLAQLDLTSVLDQEGWQNEIKRAFGGENMKFDVIIGNPPYQEVDGGAKASASPLYHKFIHGAKQLRPRLISFIIPARWYSGGKGLDQFREEMLNDKHIRELHDFFDATECFPDVDISGGVCYYLWDSEYNGECTVVSHRHGKTSIMDRPLRWRHIDLFIRFNEAISILEKIHKKDKEFISFSQDVSARKPFGLPTNVEVKKTPSPGDVRIYAYPENGYISRSEISRNQELVDKIKVLVAYVYGERGEFPYMVIARPFIGEAGTCCSETYLVARVCESLDEAKNVVSYMCTRFFRFLVLLMKNTQHATSKVYSLVPVQDFSESWTDQKLYSKYGLTANDIEFIESLVRPMERQSP